MASALIALLAAILSVGLLVRAFHTSGPGVPTGPDVGQLHWSHVDDPSFKNALMDAVVQGGPGFVAVGQTADGSGIVAPGTPRDGLIWVSSDGLQWRRLPGTFGGGLFDVAAGPDGLVAIGGDQNGPTVYTSEDGIHWTQQSGGFAVFGDNGYVNAITVGGPGFVVVGSTVPPHGIPHDNVDGAVWTSTNGTTWQLIPDLTPFEGPGGQDVEAVTQGPGGLVAVGATQRAFTDASTHSEVWTSEDGISWTRNLHPDDYPGSGMTSITVGGPGYVAAGWKVGSAQPTPRADAGDAAVWTSNDGAAWDLAPGQQDVFTGPDNQSVSAVVGTSGGLVATGASSSNAAAIWVSADGLTWSAVPNHDALFGPGKADNLEPGPSVYIAGTGIAVSADGSTTVVVGLNAQTGRAMVWVGL